MESAPLRGKWTALSGSISGSYNSVLTLMRVCLTLFRVCLTLFQACPTPMRVCLTLMRVCLTPIRGRVGVLERGRQLPTLCLCVFHTDSYVSNIFRVCLNTVSGVSNTDVCVSGPDASVSETDSGQGRCTRTRPSTLWSVNPPSPPLFCLSNCTRVTSHPSVEYNPFTKSQLAFRS